MSEPLSIAQTVQDTEILGETDAELEVAAVDQQCRVSVAQLLMKSLLNGPVVHLHAPELEMK